jgi:hypothetical protein
MQGFGFGQADLGGFFFSRLGVPSKAGSATSISTSATSPGQTPSRDLTQIIYNQLKYLRPRRTQLARCEIRATNDENKIAAYR